MNGEGIMSLPAGPMGSTPLEDPAVESALSTLRASVSPTEFSQELTYSMAEVDPVAVEEMLRELDAVDLPPNAWQALEDLVQYLLENPGEYAEVRQDVVSGGLPEEFLPGTFDIQYLTMLKVALDQMTPDMGMGRAPGMDMQPPMMMAQGGLASLPAMSPVAQSLANMGRNGDTMLAHITPQEAQMLQRQGGSGTINPYTGLPEFFLKKVWKAVTGAVKSVAKAVTGVVKSVANVVKKVLQSPVAKVAATIAAVYFLGPKGLNLAAGKLGVSNAAMAMGINSFVGSTAVNLASGMKPKDALQQGLTAGVLAGVGTGLTQGFDATAPGYTIKPSAAEMEVLQREAAIRQAGGSTGTDYLGTGDAQSLLQAQQREAIAAGGPAGGATISPVTDPLRAATTPIYPTGQGPYSITSSEIPQAAISDVSQIPSQVTSPSTSAGIGSLPTGNVPVPQVSQGTTPAFQKAPSAMDLFKQGEYWEGTKELFSPTSYTDKQLLESPEYAMYRQKGFTAEQALAKASAALNPGMFAKYGPLAAAGLGATALMGGFKGTPAEEEPLGFDPYTGLRPGELPFEQRRPDLFGPDRRLSSPTFSLADTLVQSPQYSTPAPSGVPVYQAPNMMTFQPGGVQQPYNRSGLYGIPNIYTAKRGSSPEGVTNFPRKTGPINGPGTGTSDSIPAMLSDGEFVFTAKAVRNMGNGSRRKGAARMYKLMKMLEGGAVKKG